MKCYGAARAYSDEMDGASGRDWTGRQSKAVARNRKAKKKMLHRRARRTAKIAAE